jgi:hypothetical protein
MPGTGYDENAMRVGSVRSGTRPRWLKLAVFVITVAVGAGLASFFK